ncbi:MAG TPA: hypothetical protein PJ982_00710, partial [Lacipirellulaceae bacterium]|nr:hypothetical protein [Lacipirellulaceae bacterium]
LELPETLAEGVEWTSVAEIDQAQLGRQTIRTSYRYVGPQTVDGVEFEAFAPQLAVEFAGGPAAAEVVDQKSSGQVLFRRDPGHLHSTSLDHEMTLSFAQEGQAVTQQLKQRTVMERQPDDEP